MPNGGHDSCERCTYNRLTPGRCDIVGVETDGSVACRAFRAPGESHTAARKRNRWMQKLKPGVVYVFDNTRPTKPAPRPAYKVVPVE
jgi:hypothetical protein